ncbi:MAG TPA: Gfo/Idh/MocA family oxidoreductase, partial [Ferruginibacter sp.]|nr:Gfo/Idh/MocA family oxidoreductase [Ferruginibacter sp.]
MESSRIKFAIVGCGHIGKRHAAVIERNEHAELAALCDVLEKESLNLESYDTPFFRSIDELLASDIQFDVLCVATPNGLHEEHALKGLRTGHHVVVEKPMALTKRGCE